VWFADLPQVEGPIGRFVLQQMASVAELEAGMISDRTGKVLAAVKERDKKLGGVRCKATVRRHYRLRDLNSGCSGPAGACCGSGGGSLPRSESCRRPAQSHCEPSQGA
jgi:DNA invertase Pin-like site-specific DNA recombinase